MPSEPQGIFIRKKEEEEEENKTQNQEKQQQQLTTTADVVVVVVIVAKIENWNMLSHFSFRLFDPSARKTVSLEIFA